MRKKDRILKKVLEGLSDNNTSFSDLCHLMIKLGFTERIRGSHHIFSKEGVIEILNIQPKGNKAKAYQVKQIRNLILKYKLSGEIDE